MRMFAFVQILIALGLPAMSHASPQDAVQATIIKMVNGIDAKAWQIAKSTFAENVFVDYSSMSGQPGDNVKSLDLVGGWQTLLSDVNTHHMLTNFDIEVSGDSAVSLAHVYASHTAEGIDYWDIYGRYRHELQRTDRGWVITSMTLIVHGQKGNLNFLSQVSSNAQ